jgi:RND family efflux transporter MFP subunit
MSGVMRFAVAPLACLALSACGGADSATDAPASVQVTTQSVRQGNAPTLLTAYGSARPSTDGAQTLSSAQPGQVTSIAVTAGAAVHAGQALLTFTLAPTARTAYEQAAHALAAARKQQATTTQLLAQQLATRDQMVQAEKAVSDAQIALAGLATEGAGQSVRTFTAPFDGIVTAITVAQGDRTQPDVALITVARMKDIVITVGIQPEDRVKVRAGQEATLQRLAGGAQITGRVLRVASALNVKTRLMDADIAIPAGAILPGEGLRADIHIGTVSGWLVPHAAVITASGNPHVFQMQGGKAKSVDVQVVQSSKAGDVVEGALDPHAPLIVDGAYQVDDGQAVRTGR